MEQYGEETARAHRRTLFRAMYDEVRRAYPVHMPHRAFSQGTRQPLQVEPWEAMGNRKNQITIPMTPNGRDNASVFHCGK